MTLLTIKKQENLRECLGLVSEVEGKYLEVGVYKGGSASIICSVANDKVFLADTFSGIVKAGGKDIHKNGDFADTSHESVRNYLSKCGFDNFEILVGTYPDNVKVEEPIKFVHIDVDVYQSYIDILNQVEQYIVAGGIIIFDDYLADTCPGATIAVDEYVTRNWEKYDVSNLVKKGYIRRK